MSKTPLVSVIIPAYNTDHYIGEMLECVISQTYKRLQIIVIDDGSTDKTREVIRGYQKSDPRIELVELHKGEYHVQGILELIKRKVKKSSFGIQMIS